MKLPYKGGDFQLTPDGTHVARLYSIVDIGMQPGYKDAPPNRKLIVSFELVDEKMVDGRPFAISRFYTASLNEKANLCKDIEAIAGKKIPEDKKETFEIEKMLGAACIVGVIHKVGADGRERAEIKTVSGLPKGSTASPLHNKTAFFNLEEPDWELFATLPDWITNKIQARPPQGAAPAHQAALPAGNQEEEDDIPF